MDVCGKRWTPKLVVSNYNSLLNFFPRIQRVTHAVAPLTRCTPPAKRLPTVSTPLHCMNMFPHSHTYPKKKLALPCYISHPHVVSLSHTTHAYRCALNPFPTAQHTLTRNKPSQSMIPCAHCITEAHHLSLIIPLFIRCLTC